MKLSLRFSLWYYSHSTLSISQPSFTKQFWFSEGDGGSTGAASQPNSWTETKVIEHSSPNILGGKPFFPKWWLFFNFDLIPDWKINFFDKSSRCLATLSTISTFQFNRLIFYLNDGWSNLQIFYQNWFTQRFLDANRQFQNLLLYEGIFLFYPISWTFPPLLLIYSCQNKNLMPKLNLT